MEYQSENVPIVTPVIIDNGSSVCKCGLAGDDGPKSTFPAVVATPRYPSVMHPSSFEPFIGYEARGKRDFTWMKYPLADPSSINYDHVEKIWHYCFYNELHVAPEEHPILITDTIASTKQHKEKTTQIMFETFCAPSLYVAPSPLMSLFASGRMTGLVLDSGNQLSHVVPIVDGLVHKNNVETIPFGGAHITDFLAKSLHPPLEQQEEQEIAEHLKEQLGYISMDYEGEKMNGIPITKFVLPDNKQIEVGTERFECPEVLFQPSLLGLQCPGIQDSIYSTICKHDVDERKMLFKSIVLSGGNSMFQGIKERLYKELKSLSASPTKISIYAPPERIHLAWIGGSMLASLNTFSQISIHKEQYDEEGPYIVHRVGLEKINL